MQPLQHMLCQTKLQWWRGERQMHCFGRIQVNCGLQCEQLKQWAHRRNDFIVPDHAEAAVPARAFAILVGDAPPGAEKPSGGHPHCVRWAACIRPYIFSAVYSTLSLNQMAETSIQLGHYAFKSFGFVSHHIQPFYSHRCKPGRWSQFARLPLLWAYGLPTATLWAA